MSGSSTPGSPGSAPANRANTHGETGNGSAGASSLDLKEMREDVSRLASVVAHVAERRIAHARASADIAMRESPWLTVTVAATVGFVLALVIAPRKSRSTSHQWRQALQERLPDIDLREFSRHAHLPRPQQLASVPIASRFEQFMDALSRIDTSSVAAPALEKLKSWYGSVRSAADRAINRNS